MRRFLAGDIKVGLDSIDFHVAGSSPNVSQPLVLCHFHWSQRHSPEVNIVQLQKESIEIKTCSIKV